MQYQVTVVVFYANLYYGSNYIRVKSLIVSHVQYTSNTYFLLSPFVCIYLKTFIYIFIDL